MLTTTQTRDGRILIFMDQYFYEGKIQALCCLDDLEMAGLNAALTGNPGAGGTYCIELFTGVSN